jgi:3-deoxy-D-manno-octulosonic-acid transferase
VGGSTWPGEEEILLAAYARLRQEWPDLRLLLAPRHIERAAEVERVVRAAGFEPRRRSQLPEGVDMSANARQNSVLILDTLGELVTAYALAVIAFVGKSLRVGGGHNVLEPAALGVPVAFGPHTENFQSEAETLLAAGAGEIVTDGDSLYQCIRGLLADEAKRRRMAEAGRRVVQENRGATRRNVDALAELVR